MWGRSTGLAMHLAGVIEERQARGQIEAKRNISLLKRDIADQHNELERWVNDPNNRRYHYYEYVGVAYLQIKHEASLKANATLDELQDTRADFNALSKALKTMDVTDLVARAKRYIECANPRMIAVGVAFALVGIAICLASMYLPLMLLGGGVAVAGMVAALMGARKVPTDKALLLFGIAKSIDPDVSQQIVLPADIDPTFNLPYSRPGMV